MHRDAHAQPFADLADAWHRFFTGQNERPAFKKKGETSDSFYVANDTFQIVDSRVKLPKIGWVRLRESLRFPGKILGARMVREADQWFFAVHVSRPDSINYRTRTGHGVDVVKTFATLSTSDKIAGPKAPRRALRRFKRRQRAITRTMQAAKVQMGLASQDPLPKGTRLPRGRNWDQAKNHVARTHFRVANLRRDFLPKTSTDLCRKNQATGSETLSDDESSVGAEHHRPGVWSVLCFAAI